MELRFECAPRPHLIPRWALTKYICLPFLLKYSLHLLCCTKASTQLVHFRFISNCWHRESCVTHRIDTIIWNASCTQCMDTTVTPLHTDARLCNLSATEANGIWDIGRLDHLFVCILVSAGMKLKKPSHWCVAQKWHTFGGLAILSRPVVANVETSNPFQTRCCLFRFSLAFLFKTLNLFPELA